MDTQRISAANLKRRLGGKEHLAVLDCRSNDNWELAEAEIAGSIRVPPEDLDHAIEAVPRDSTVVTYSTGPNDDESSARVAQRLTEEGWKHVFDLAGGFEAWKSAGYATKPKPKH